MKFTDEATEARRGWALKPGTLTSELMLITTSPFCFMNTGSFNPLINYLREFLSLSYIVDSYRARK